MKNKEKVILYLVKNFFTGSLIVLGGIVTLYGVTAFESLTTTPGDTGNQSLGSQILSKLPTGGFDRTTDSLEALSEKIDASSGGGIFTKCQVRHTSSATYPTCPLGFTNIHTYTSAKIYGGMITTDISSDTAWFYTTTSPVYATLACTVCKEN